MRRVSPTYAALIELLLREQGVENRMTAVSYDNGNFERTRTEEITRRLPQSITIGKSDLVDLCTPLMSHIVLTIFKELKNCNALWKCNPLEMKKSSSHRKAINRMLEVKILIETETPNIYLVNPILIRKGDFFTVVMTTANMLQNVPKVTEEHVINKRAVKKLRLVVTNPNAPIIEASDIILDEVTENDTSYVVEQ